MLSLLKSLRTRIAREARVFRAFRLTTGTPILIYQMGKVGSSSVYRTLLKTKFRSSVFHVHFLSDDLFAHEQEHISNGIRAGARYSTEHALRRYIIASNKPRVKIITLVRDPVAVLVSDVFQNPHLFPNLISRDKARFRARNLSRAIESEVLTERACDYVNGWFDRELKNVFGVDVYSCSFDKHRGFQIYPSPSAPTLLIRLEDLTPAGPNALSVFLGSTFPICLEKANERSGTLERSRYVAIKTAKIDREVLERVYSGKLAQHFYTDEQIHAFVQRWSQ
jgi:hypothetical protein